MNKLLKFITIGGITVLASAVVIMIIKEETKKLEKEEKKIKKEFEELGLSEKKVNEEFKNEEPDNFVKALYHSIEFGALKGKLWDRDLLKVHSDIGERNGILDNENVIHVMQSDTQNGGKVLEFYFEIPSTTYMRGNNRYPRIRDYEEAIKLCAYHMASDIIKFTPNPMWELVGYYVVSYKIKGKVDPNGEPIEFQEQIRIPKKDYESYSTPGKKYDDGLFKYIRYMYTTWLKEKERKPVEVKFYASEGDVGDEIYDLKLVTVLLMFKISFPIIITNGVNSFGVDLKSALKCLKYMTDELVITRGGAKPGNNNGNEEIRYEYILFHSKDYKHPEKGFDFLRYYNTVLDLEDPNFPKRKIITECMEYCD